MVYYYVPEKLIQARQEIVRRHRKISSPKAEDIEAQNFKQIVLEIEALEPYAIESYSYTMKKNDLSLLAIYMPKNTYGVRLTNHMKVLGFRWDTVFMKSLYQHWQNYYTTLENRNIFTFLSKEIKEDIENGDVPTVSAPKREQFYQIYSLYPEKIADSIEKGCVVEYFSTEAAKYQCDSLEEFKEALKLLGLNLDFALAKECVNDFYFVCSGKVYLKLGDRKVFELIKTMRPKLARRILINMLSKLKDEELDQFNEVADFYYRRTGDYGREQFTPYFNDVPSSLIRKYGTWINRWNIKRIFVNDTRDRIKFWLQYADKAMVSHMKETDCLIFKFPKSVFIEFGEIGPVYQYGVSYYDSTVRNMIERTSKDTELKRWLRNSTSHDMLQEHRGYWQAKVAARIEQSF